MRRLLTLLLIAVLGLPGLPLTGRAELAAPPAGQLDDEIERIIQSFTSQERVGQLMLITFEGASLAPDTAIAQLIAEYNIGGVVLLAENDNINGQVNTPRLVQSLTTDLQRVAYDAAQITTDRRKTPRAYVPLFIATTHTGNGQPGTQIALGTTPLPSYFSLGATWNPDYAQQVGQIAGSELSTMGINLLLGPPLDVVQRPQAGRALDLGVNIFGGVPFWVGQMGQAYIAGVHEGSEGRMAVIAQDFPGLGFADTEPDQEIPVVPRSVDEMRRFELIPFFAVTGDAVDPLARADGFQCANIRYQGENIRSITRPICVDEQAFEQLLSLDYFRSWRNQGLIISSSLGTRAIRRYYNITPFPHRQVAREAFLAGNDMLFLSNFGPHPGDDPFETIVDTIEFFAERYDSDPVFRAQVDQSLRRILRLKLTLYGGDLSLENVLRSPRRIDSLGTASTPLYSLAQQSVTLIAPRRESLPPPPARDDTIVIFTDVRLVQQCSYCAAYPLVSVNALEVAIERLYGPYAGAQIRPERVLSFSFSQLHSYLGGSAEEMSSETSEFRTNQRIGEALRDADWIVFVMLDVSPSLPPSTVVSDFLESQAELVERSKIVVMALGAPQYLSATEISKFAAYYGLFSSTPPFIDAAARALFQESTFTGALPVSLPAVGYDIFERTAPDPSQIIQVELESLAGEAPPLVNASDVLAVRPGERLLLRTKPIVDRNGHRVPDGTPVEFTLHFVNDNLQNRIYSVTEDGVARAAFTPNQPGRVQITASSGDASRSVAFQINVTSSAMTPTPAGSNTTPAANTSPTPTNPGTAVAMSQADGPTGDSIERIPGSPLNAAAAEEPLESRDLDLFDFILALFGLALIAVPAFSAGMSTTLSVDGGYRMVLGSIVAGLIGYVYYGVGGPGSAEMAARLGDLAPMIATAGTSLIGLIYTWWTLRHVR